MTDSIINNLIIPALINPEIITTLASLATLAAIALVAHRLTTNQEKRFYFALDYLSSREEHVCPMPADVRTHASANALPFAVLAATLISAANLWSALGGFHIPSHPLTYALAMLLVLPIAAVHLQWANHRVWNIQTIRAALAHSEERETAWDWL